MYKVKGTTDTVTECDLCGRADLKKTVMIASLDVDGNEEAINYYGSVCAGQITGYTTKTLNKEARRVDRVLSRERTRKQNRDRQKKVQPWFDFLSSRSSKPTVPEKIEELGGFANARVLYKESLED